MMGGRKSDTNYIFQMNINCEDFSKYPNEWVSKSFLLPWDSSCKVLQLLIQISRDWKPCGNSKEQVCECLQYRQALPVLGNSTQLELHYSQFAWASRSCLLQPTRLLTLLFGAMAGLRRTTYKWPSFGIEHYIFLFFFSIATKHQTGCYWPR